MRSAFTVKRLSDATAASTLLVTGLDTGYISSAFLISRYTASLFVSRVSFNAAPAFAATTKSLASLNLLLAALCVSPKSYAINLPTGRDAALFWFRRWLCARSELGV